MSYSSYTTHVIKTQGTGY